MTQTVTPDQDDDEMMPPSTRGRKRRLRRIVEDSDDSSGESAQGPEKAVKVESFTKTSHGAADRKEVIVIDDDDDDVVESSQQSQVQEPESPPVQVTPIKHEQAAKPVQTPQAAPSPKIQLLVSSGSVVDIRKAKETRMVPSTDGSGDATILGWY